MDLAAENMEARNAGFRVEPQGDRWVAKAPTGTIIDSAPDNHSAWIIVRRAASAETTKLELLRKAVLARVACWDAVRALEKATVGEEGFTCRADDEVHEYIGCLAAGLNSDDASCVTDEHVSMLDDIIKVHS